MKATIKSIKVFCSYSHDDTELHDQLKKHLCSLVREFGVKVWSDRCINPGQDWQKEIDQNINTADIILLLISNNFIASDYCYGVEMKRALERRDANQAQVISIILKSCSWENIKEINAHQVLPDDGKAVALLQGDKRNNAFKNIVEKIRENIVEKIHKITDEVSVFPNTNFSKKQLFNLSKIIIRCCRLKDSARWETLCNQLPEDFKQVFQHRSPDSESLKIEVVRLLESFLSKHNNLNGFLCILQKCNIKNVALQEVRKQIKLQENVVSAKNLVRNIQVQTRQLHKFYCLSMPDRSLASAHEVDKMVENLGSYDKWHDINISPLFVFVEKIAQYIEKDYTNKSAELKKWVETQAEYQYLVADLREKLKEENFKPQDFEYLLIDLSNTYKGYLEYWLFREKECYLKDEVPCDTSTVEVSCSSTPDSIRSALQNILERAESKANSSLITELFVSQNMLLCDLDRLKIPNGPFLGIQYPTLLRWKGQRRRNIWIEITRKIREKVGSNTLLKNWWLNTRQFTLDELKAKLSQDYDGQIIGLQLVPSEENQPANWLMTILYNGAPFAFWPRQEPPDSKKFQKLLDALLLKADKLEDVPFLVKNFRAESEEGKDDHPGKYLTLFWDDPNDYDPSTVKLSYPSQRGG